MEKQVWLIRHAESASNAGFKTSNSGTIPITELGVKQAEDLAKLIESKPDLIIHSKFLRTWQTAKPTMEKYPDVPIDVLPIHEFDFLARIRCINLNAEQRKPMVKAYWERNDPQYIDGDGAESFIQFTNRVINSLRAIESRNEKFVLVFTHGHVIRAIWQYITTGSTDMEAYIGISKHLLVHNTQIFKASFSVNDWEIEPKA